MNFNNIQDNVMKHVGNLAKNGDLSTEIKKYASLIGHVENELLNTKAGKLGMTAVNVATGPLQIISSTYDAALKSMDVAKDVGIRAAEKAGNIGLNATETAGSIGIDATDTLGRLGIKAAKNIGELGTVAAVQTLRFSTKTALDIGEIAADGSKAIAKSTFDLANKTLNKTFNSINNVLDYFSKSVEEYLKRQKELKNLEEYLQNNGNTKYFQDTVLKVFDQIIKQHLDIVTQMEKMDNSMLKDKIFAFRMNLFCKTKLLETYYSNHFVIPLPTKRCKLETNTGISKVDNSIRAIASKLKKNYGVVRAELTKIKPSIILQIQQVNTVESFLQVKQGMIERVETIMGNVEKNDPSVVSLTTVREWLSKQMEILEKTMAEIEDFEREEPDLANALPVASTAPVAATVPPVAPTVPVVPPVSTTVPPVAATVEPVATSVPPVETTVPPTITSESNETQPVSSVVAKGGRKSRHNKRKHGGKRRTHKKIARKRTRKYLWN
jgi:polyhydroxyalkanoate synthesis regulator protein